MKTRDGFGEGKRQKLDAQQAKQASREIAEAVSPEYTEGR